MTASGSLRVATFNIRNGRGLDGRNSWPLRRRTTARAMAGLDADVLALQEAFSWQLRWLLGRVEGYVAAGDGRDGGRHGEHTPVLTRAGVVEVVESRTRWYGDSPDTPGSRLDGASFPRIATTVRLTLGSGGPEVVVAGTHLDEASAGNRLRSAEQLVSWLPADVPTIVLGDLNDTPSSAVVARLEEAGLRSALPPDAGGTEHAFTGRTDRKRIDHILVSRHWEVVGADIPADRQGPFLPSDHWPVVADLRLR